MGFSGWQIGLLIGANSLTALLTTLPMGVSNDLYISRRLILISLIVLALTYFMISFSSLFFILMITFVLLGIFTGLAQISIKSLIYKTSGEGKKGKYFSIMAFAEDSGIAIGSLIGGLLLVKFSYSAIFRITALLFILIAPVVFFLPKTGTQIFKPASYRKELIRKDVIFFSVITFLYSYHWGAEKTVYTLFLKESLNFSQGGIGIFLGITVSVLALSTLFYGKMLDMEIASLKKLIVTGLWLSSVGHIFLALSETQFQAYLFRMIHELGDASFMLFSYVMTSNLFRKSRIGGGSGFISQVAVAGTFTGSMASGIIFQHFGTRIPMIAAGAFSLLALYFVKDIKLVGSDKSFIKKQPGTLPSPPL
jgi:MFS family permease